MLEEVGLHQVVQDVVLTNPLHGAAAGGAEGGALHPAGVAGGAEDVHAGLQAEGQTPISSLRTGSVPGNPADATK